MKERIHQLEEMLKNCKTPSNAQGSGLRDINLPEPTPTSNDYNNLVKENIDHIEQEVSHKDPIENNKDTSEKVKNRPWYWLND